MPEGLPDMDSISASVVVIVGVDKQRVLDYIMPNIAAHCDASREKQIMPNSTPRGNCIVLELHRRQKPGQLKTNCPMAIPRATGHEAHMRSFFFSFLTTSLWPAIDDL